MNRNGAIQIDRVEDYLNDKLQTFADFESLDSLLSSVQTQQELLRNQLEDARKDLSEADAASSRVRAAVAEKARSFAQQQADIDQRLLVVTRSDTSEDAVQKFDKSMGVLRRLEIANGYLELLSDIDQVKSRSQENLKNNPDASIQSYVQLRYLETTLRQLQADADGAAPHLVDEVARIRQRLFENIRASLQQTFKDVLEKILWPKPGVVLPESVKGGWNSTVQRLLQLQMPDLESLEESGGRRSSELPRVLLPLEIMVQPLSTRFQYHFSGDRPTNKIDKPEYFLSHALELLNSYAPFVSDYIQPSLSQTFGQSHLANNPCYIDAVSALISAVLPMVRVKSFARVNEVLTQPPLLSHMIHELMGFDTTLRDEWRYSDNGSRWRGLTGEILGHNDWFDQWLNIEKDFALSRYQSIIDDPGSGTLDFDSVDPKVTKPTKATIRVNDLLETITDRYKPLSSFSQKIRFLIDIQIWIFDRYHNRLHSSLEAFLAMTSSLGRRVQGVSEADVANLQGVNGLDRLCRVYGSAEYLERAMRDWSDGVFFLDLWNELQNRVKHHHSGRDVSGDNTTRPRSFAGPLSFSDVASRTSNTLTANAAVEDADDLQDETTGALFDETASAYARLRSRTEGIIVETLTQAIRESLRPYARGNVWSSLATPSSGASGDALTPSLDLNSTLEVLTSSFAFLGRALATLALRRIGKLVARSMDQYVFDRVLMGNNFSSQGAAQVSVDVQTLVAIVDRYVGGDVARRAMRRSLEAIALLGLKVKPSAADTDDDGDYDGDAWADQDGDDADDRLELEAPGLWEVERRLFADNESARDVLAELRCEVLTENEARQVLQRRVEVNA